MQSQRAGAGIARRTKDGERALVIGGSIGGLLAARVLADHYERVTVVDWDEFPEHPEHRRRVPQSRHAHALLERGQQIIDRLFPGIAEDLRADGALAAGAEVLAIVTPAGKLPAPPRPPAGMDPPGTFASRFLLEWHVRRRVAALEGVEFVTGTRVTGLLGQGSRVTGVEVEATTGPGILSADLVVDASGRHSKAPEWLAELGCGTVEEETIESGMGYASRFYERPADWPADWEMLIVNGRPPDNPRAGLILPIENGRWHVTVGGLGGHFPPTDEEGFLEWARSLADPSLYEAIRVARPLTPIRAFRTPQNRLRHYERLERWPEGFIATGDSVCAFNPIYGQGMTVSAMDAELLERSLRRRASRPRRGGFERRFQRELARLVAAPWLVASAEDLRWGVASSGARPAWATGAIHRYMDLVLRRARGDAVVAGAYMAVIGMLALPRSLFAPGILIRVASEVLRPGRGEDEPALPREAIEALRALPAHSGLVGGRV